MTEPTGEKTSKRKSLYFKDPFTDLAFLHSLTLHGFKGSEIGECYYAAAQIQEGDPQSWREAWNSLAEKVEAIGRLAQAKGHRVSAREAYLRAVTYYRNVAWGWRESVYRQLHQWDTLWAFFILQIKKKWDAASMDQRPIFRHSIKRAKSIPTL